MKLKIISSKELITQGDLALYFIRNRTTYIPSIFDIGECRIIQLFLNFLQNYIQSVTFDSDSYELLLSSLVHVEALNMFLIDRASYKFMSFVSFDCSASAILIASLFLGNHDLVKKEKLGTIIKNEYAPLSTVLKNTDSTTSSSTDCLYFSRTIDLAP